MKHLVLLLILPTLGHIDSGVASELEFLGTPTIKVEVVEGVSLTSPLSSLEATNLRVVIVRDGDKYLWQSRGRAPLSKSLSGAYVTYTALNGAGYIRVLSPAMLRLLKQLSDAEREKAIVYTEHMAYQLGSVTYFGK